MTATKQRTGLQKDLSDYLDEDVIKYIKRRQSEGWTYRQIATDLSESGWTVNPLTVSSWMSYERRRK